DGATTASGEALNLGAGGTALNEGVWSVGRSNEISHTALTGDFTQTAGGSLLLDIDHLARTTDRIDVIGSAQLAGAIELNQINISKIQPGATRTGVVSTG